LEAYGERLDVDEIRSAYELAVRVHKGQKRASGEEYVSHCVEVATILAQFKLDTASLVSGLVHDTVEDTSVTLDDLRAQFGDEVAALVDGVTKIGKVTFSSHTEKQVENYRKLLLSVAQDARVILVKLADRLHNMRTLEHLLPSKQRRIATETREIYAPLAHRLGMAEVKWELEDLAFKFLEPDVYDDLRRKIQKTRKARERQILELRRPLEEALKEAGISGEVTGRPKHLWSIYSKMLKRTMPFEEINDLMALRVITDSVQSCYAALGVIHSRWTPIQERFHDYIATPKSNMYQSIHTTVFGPGGRRYEVQIRSDEMHRTAEQGIAAHWRYKEGKGKGDEVDEALNWFRQVLDWQQDASEPEEFMQFLRMDLFQGEMFVFTPKGEVKQLPTGSTPIDFAFAVHTEVGMHCAGAKVNGRIAPLSRPLRNSDTVEIITNPRQRPSRDWLAFVKTSRARTRIRRWVREDEFEASVRVGRELLDKELRRIHRDRPAEKAIAAAASELGLPSADHIFDGLARGDLGPTSVLRVLFPDWEQDDEVPTPSPLQRLTQKLLRPTKGLKVSGADSVMIRYSQCCQPLPGDDVIGYVTTGRGVSIHRVDCANVLNLDNHRRVDIQWTAEKDDQFVVKLSLRGTDRRGLLSDIAAAITETGTNIHHADIRSVTDGMVGEFMVEVPDLVRLEKVVRRVRSVKGVISVERRENFRESDLIEL